MRRKKYRGMSRHHRRPRSKNGTDEPDNISIVDRYDHQAYHRLFGVYHPNIIAEILNETWIDKKWKFICVKR